MTSPDDSAERVLEGVLGAKKMTFSEFRSAMYAEHPEFLTDDQIHDLYIKHVMEVQQIDLGPVADFLSKAIPPATDSTWLERDDLKESLEEMRRGESVVRIPQSKPFDVTDLNDVRSARWRLQQAVDRFEASKKKPLGDVTLGEVAGSIAKKARSAFKILRENGRRDA